MAKVKVEKSIRSLNEMIAAENRAKLKSAGVTAINIMGSPGAGKTTLLEHILPELCGSLRVAVIEGDLATDNDARRVSAAGAVALQINTNGGCHLDAKMVSKRLDALRLDELDLVVIENVGNLVCPSSFDLGEDIRMVVLSLAEGDDKPEKYPVAFINTDIVAVTKTDLAPYINADAEKMTAQIAKINPKIKVFVCSFAGGVYDDGGLAGYLAEKTGKKNEKIRA